MTPKLFVSVTQYFYYIVLVRVYLKYSAAFWDLGLRENTNQITAKFQMQAARWTTCNFDKRTSFSNMIET